MAGEIEVNTGFWKKGADWDQFLTLAGGDVPKALGLWAKAMEESAARLRKLAEAVAELDPGAVGHGGQHYAAIHTDVATAMKLKRRKGLEGSIMCWSRA